MPDYQHTATGKHLKKLREFVDLNQQEFAKSIDVSRFNCCDMELGKSSITSKTAIKLYNTHKVNIHWLYTGEGAMFIEDGSRVGAADPGVVAEPPAVYEKAATPDTGAAAIIAVLQDNIKVKDELISMLRDRVASLEAINAPPK